MPRPQPISLVVALLPLLLSSRATAASTTTTTTVLMNTTTTLPTIPPSTLCTCANNQCVVTGHKKVSPGSIDFGACDLILANNATVTLTNPGTLRIAAASLTLNPRAAIIGSGGLIFVNVSGTIQLSTKATIDVSAVDAGSADIDLSSGGAATLDGSLVAKATSAAGSGGTVNVTAGNGVVPGDVEIGDLITVKGGGQGGGGGVSVTANNGAITVNAAIDATGGEFDGGTIDLEADRDLVSNNTLDVSGGGLSGSGGIVMLNSNVAGNVTINGAVVGGAGGSVSEGGGAGGELDSFTTQGKITVNASVTLNGGSNGGDGGTVDLEPTGDLIVPQPLFASGTGVGAFGGTVIFFATGNATLGPIDVSARAGSGGSVSLNTVGPPGGAATVPAGTEINADSAPGTTAGGGIIQLVDETITVDGFLHANGGGGEVNPQACNLMVHASGHLQADGNGTNLLQASGPMQVAGTLGAGANTLDYFDPGNLPVTTGATITPAPTIVQDNPAFTPLCPGQATTTTSTTSSTTTTTLAVGTTTTTVSTTTTTLVVTTSTTTSTLTTTSTTHPSPNTTSTSTTSTTRLSTTTTITTSTTSSTRSTSTTTPAPTTTTTTPPLPTTSTTTSRPTTTTATTRPPGGCDSVPTFASIDCRLDALIARIQDATGIARQQAQLVDQLTKAKDRKDAAEGLCRSADTKHARTRLKQAIRTMIQYEQRLRSNTGRRLIPSALGAELIADGEGIRVDLKTLRDALRCPENAAG
jgi:hypothetical protein